MRFFYFVRSFINFLGTQNVYHLRGEWDGKAYTDPPIHWYKTRTGFKTAWNLAGMIWYGPREMSGKWLAQRLWFDLTEFYKNRVGFVRTIFYLWGSTTVGGVTFTFRSAVAESYKIHIEQQLPF